jgi:hypothetical protein
MVTIIENWATIIGIVISIAPAEPGQKFVTLTLQIERTEAVENYPMLLQQKPGDRIMVRVLPEQLGSTSGLVKSKISIRVRRARDPQIVFAAPDWTAEAQETQ